MFTLIIGLIIVAAVLLILIILAQNSKGGGLSSQFGGAGASNMIGVKKTTDLLERLTWGLAIFIFVLSAASSFVAQPSSTPTDEFRERAQEENAGPTLDLGDINTEGETIDLGETDSTAE